jgi:lipopolysaccharide biosynthesis glycosyltransferase
MADIISIAFTCNDKYAKHVAVVVQSILTNAATEDRHEFHVLTRDLTPESEQRLCELATGGKATMFIHQIDIKLLAGMPEGNNYPLETYFRLLLPEILLNHQKVLYLDADLIVLSSLQELWDFQIEDVAVAAAIDISTLFGDEHHFKRLETLQLPKDYVYFNGGVLLLNLKVMRQMHLLEKAREWASENAALIWSHDQDILNVFTAGNCRYFHLRWNLQVTLITLFQYGRYYSQEQIEAVSSPAILHYISERKPWRREFKLPYKNLYFQYLAQTPWNVDPLAPITFYQIWRRLLAELSWIYRHWFLRHWLLRK